MKHNFPAILRSLRLDKNLKQNDLAKQLSTTQRKISYWENGTTEPDIASLWELAEFFEISIDELVGKE